jgi:hypothetical protein
MQAIFRADPDEALVIFKYGAYVSISQAVFLGDMIEKYCLC